MLIIAQRLITFKLKLYDRIIFGYPNYTTLFWQIKKLRQKSDILPSIMLYLYHADY